MRVKDIVGIWFYGRDHQSYIDYRFRDKVVLTTSLLIKALFSWRNQ